MRTAYLLAASLAIAVLAGCDDLRYTPLPQSPPATDIGSRFDPARCGSIAGTVTWDGPVPTVPPFPVPGFTLTNVPPADVPNPNAPDVDPATRGVRSAVVFLRGVDPAAARPWDHPSAAVELDDHAIRVVQDGKVGRVGFVRAGAQVRFASRAGHIAGVRAVGNRQFTLMFPADGVPVVRTIAEPGRVELASASGQFWAAADLFVGDHPYFARLAAAGRFKFNDVPEGEYDLVVWHPNWHAAEHERDPETGAIARRKYAPPTEVVRRVTVVAGRVSDVNVSLSSAHFPPIEPRR